VKSSLTVIGYPKLTRARVTLRWPHTYRPGSRREVAAHSRPIHGLAFDRRQRRAHRPGPPR
jgi:hypothetical protein